MAQIQEYTQESDLLVNLLRISSLVNVDDSIDSLAFDQMVEELPSGLLGSGVFAVSGTNEGISIGVDKSNAVGYIQSRNFVTGTTGWRIDSNGDVEFDSGTFRGTITATTGSIGGFDIGSDYVRDVANSMGLASTVTAGDDVRGWAGATFANRATASLRWTEGGAFFASSATITGAVTITSGSGIANLSDAGALAVLSVIGNAYITDLNVSKLAAGSISSKDIVLAITAGIGDVAIRAGKTDFTNTESGFILGLDDSDSDLAKFYIGDATTYFNWTGAGVVIAGNVTATVGSSIATSYLSGFVAQANLNIANMGWTQTSAFSVTDTDTVAWGAGTLTTAGGTSYSIGAGNTGNMVARTYIYLDIAVSTTAYQTTTTATTAVGTGKILVATAINGTTDARFEVFGGVGGLHADASDLLVANSVVAGLISVTNLAAINADLGAVTAGSISVVSGANTIGLTPSGANAIFSGTTGSPEFAVTPAGVMTATSGILTGLTVRSASGNARVELNTSGLEMYNSAGLRTLGILQGAAQGIVMANTITSSAAVAGILLSSSLTLEPGVNFNASVIDISASITRAASGTHPNFWGVAIQSVDLSLGSATVTTATSLYVAQAPTGGTVTNRYGLFVDNDARSRFDGRVLFTKGADIASGSTITLGADGNFFDITGTTTINHITTTDWIAGSTIILQFDASVTVTHNAAAPPANTAAILLSGAGNFSATANDTLTLIYDGTTFRELARTVI